MLATLPRELAPGTLDQFELDLLEKIREYALSGVVIDLSSVELMDLTEFAKLKRIVQMTKMLGPKTVVVGLRPGVVAGLVALGADAGGLTTALNMELGLEVLRAQTSSVASAQATELPEVLRQALLGTG